ncbi:hypothetical protein [Antarctobacter sp.]|uniref:hypothetical protein n=1 Tax=Antarctobacter sp. TaxID=1872577 RepID=UPI003A8D8F96
MFRKCTALVATLALPMALPAPLAAQPEECLGHDLNDPAQSIPMNAPTHTWTLYNLGPGEVVIHASTGDNIPGPAPSSDPKPAPFRGEVGTSYAIALAGPGLTIVYICPGP